MRTLFGLLMLLWATLAPAQVSRISPFLGTWDNRNPNTREITRLELSQSGGQDQLHLWFAASPTPFDAGLHDVSVHTETTPIGSARRNGTLLRTEYAAARERLEILLERGSGEQLAVTLVRLGSDRPSFERMSFRRASPTGDCLNYHPNNVALRGPRIVEGRHILMAFSDPRDRELGLALARSYASYCTIGRDNARPNRNDYLFEYWSGGRNGSTAPTYDCMAYDARRLRVVNLGAEGFRIDSLIADGALYLQRFNTLADATAGLAVFRRHNFQCFIGRGGGEVFQYLR
jgi:hypothetical protein